MRTTVRGRRETAAHFNPMIRLIALNVLALPETIIQSF
jgi:hypothetical protein